MIIQHNLLAGYSNRQLGINTKEQNNSIFKLSSGYRINRAADNAAGLSISEKMRSQIRGLDRASDNIQDGISLVQTADGALGNIQSMVQRIRELSVQSSNDTNTSSDRDSIQKEVDNLIKEVTRISEDTEFNKRKLLNGNLKDSTATSSTVPLINSSNTKPMTVSQAINSIASDKVGLIFTNENEYVATQTATGNSTSTAYGTAIMDTLQNQIVPQAVQSILNTYSGALSYLAGSSVGIGLKLYSEDSSTLASVTVGYGSMNSLNFRLSVNVNSLSFTSSGGLTSDSREELEATISHEMVHALMDESVTAGIFGYTTLGGTVTPYPKWFKEGMAQTAGGGGNWVRIGLWLESSSSNSNIKSALATLENGTVNANYGVGYLACMYLGYMAAGGTGAVNARTISSGIDKIWQSLVSGKSLDQTIADYTKYSGLADFTTNLQNDASSYQFIRNLISEMGWGRGSVLSGNLAEDDLLSNTNITNLSLFKLNTSNDTVTNVYPSNVNIFSGGAATASGTKAVPEAPDAPAVNGGSGGPTSTVINLSDLANVNFAGISGVEYDQAANTITIKANGTYQFTGNNSNTKIVLNASVTADIYANNVTCKEIDSNTGSSLKIHGQISSTNGLNGPTSLINYGVINSNITQAGVTNYGTINGDLDINGASNFDAGIINGDVTEHGNGILNRGKITGTCTGFVHHFVDSFTKNITAPSTVNVGNNLPGSTSLTSILHVNYNGTSTDLTGIWVVKDKNGNEVPNPATTIMNEGDSYTYTLTFDGTPYDMYFNSETVAALLAASSSLQSPDGGTIAASGRMLSYTYTLNAGAVNGGPTAGGSSSHIGGLNLQIGANSEQSMQIYIDSMSAKDLGIDDLKTDTFEHSQDAILSCDKANKKISALRSSLGAYQNRLEHSLANSDNMSENLQNAESRIRDLDMANEMVKYSKNNILLQVGQSILAQSNQQPNGVLSLLN